MKKTLKTILCTILTMVLLLPAVYAAEVSEDGSADRASTAASESSSADAASAAETLQAQKENAEKKDILILFTSDVHCGIDKGFGYAGLEQIRKHEQDKGNEVILVDNGDNIQGDAMGLLTKGEALLDLMNKMGYSVAIPGNHEFDYGMDNFLSLAKKAQFKYISCNFQYRGENVFDSYVIREIGGRKIAFVGVTTPTTLTASTPTAFLDQEESCRPWTYADVISHTTGIDAFLDGHSHDLDQVIMKNKDGKEVPRAACGTKMQAIGWCRIPVEGELTTGIYSWTMDDSAPEVFGIENDISEAVKTARAQADKMMEEKIAVAEQELTINDPAAVDPKWGKVRMIRRAETNLGDLCTDALRIMSDADIAILGGGSIRANIPAGDVTMKNIYEVFPYGNESCVVEATGQQILDALEWGAQSVPAENGGFLQVSGLTYEIHTYIDSTCTKNEKGMFTGVEGERRVKNVKVDGDPIDPEANYKVAGTDYYLLMGGDGHTAFDGSERLDAGGVLDTQMLSDYITGKLGGVIGKEYSDPSGEDRIVIVEEKPAE